MGNSVEVSPPERILGKTKWNKVGVKNEVEGELEHVPAQLILHFVYA